MITAKQIVDGRMSEYLILVCSRGGYNNMPLLDELEFRLDMAAYVAFSISPPIQDFYDEIIRIS